MAKLTTVLLIVGTGLGTTGKNLNTHQTLKTGATDENLALVARNQTGPTYHNINSNPFSHIDGRGQNQHYGGPQRSQPREQTGAASRGEQMDNNSNFSPRRQQHAHFNEGYNRRYSPPTFPSLAFSNTMASDTVGRSIIQLAENQSHSVDFHSSGATISNGCIQRDDTFQPGKEG